MTTKKIIRYLAAAAAIASAACSKSVSYDTDLQLKPLVQFVSGGDIQPLADVVAYAYPEADTTQWTVLSHEDALAGVLTSKDGQTTRQDGIRGAAIDTEGRRTWLSMPLSTPSTMLVAAASDSRQYGYEQLALAENLTPMTVVVVFYPWTEASSYKKGNWWMFNEDYVPADECQLRIEALVETAEGAEAEQLTGMKAWAFEGFDPASWQPASYDDALAGIITRTDGDETYATGTAGRALTGEGLTHLLGLEATSESLVVVVDSRNRQYAVASLTPGTREEPALTQVVFRPWLDVAEYTSGPWRIVNSTYVAPEESGVLLSALAQELEQGDATPVEGLRAWAFAGVDPGVWLPASYADALAGRLTNAASGATRADGTAGRALSDAERLTWLGLEFTGSTALVIAVDTAHGIYAYAVVANGSDQEPAAYEVTFPLWREEPEFMSGDWVIVNTPAQSGEEGGEGTEEGGEGEEPAPAAKRSRR